MLSAGEGRRLEGGAACAAEGGQHRGRPEERGGGLCIRGRGRDDLHSRCGVCRMRCQEKTAEFYGRAEEDGVPLDGVANTPIYPGTKHSLRCQCIPAHHPPIG